MYITLESGGSRPPTTDEATQIRAALLAAASADVAQLYNRYNYITANSPATLTVNGGTLFVNCDTGNITIYLPAITPAMQSFDIRRVDTNSAYTLTVLPAVADVGVLIDGSASLLLPRNSAVTIRSNTTQWRLTTFISTGDSIVNRLATARNVALAGADQTAFSVSVPSGTMWKVGQALVFEAKGTAVSSGVDDKFQLILDTTLYDSGLIDIDGDFLIKARLEYVSAGVFDIGVDVAWQSGIGREMVSTPSFSAVLPDNFVLSTTGAMTLHHAFLEMRGAGN